MSKIRSVTKMTENPFLNMYYLDAENRLGGDVNYYVASRASSVEEMKLVKKDHRPDGVAIYSLYGEKRDRIVLVRQYRYAIDDYIYEFPAGLVEKSEDYCSAAIRELREETGLNLEPLKVPEYLEKPTYTTIGMTDECCSMVYGYASGTVSTEGEEDSEEIEVVLADRKEAKRILEEENVAMMCAYMLMHFVASPDPFYFLKCDEDRDI